MKIGIITLHRAHNYGAVLQCYGLQKVLMDMGHIVKIVDFAPSDVFGYYDYHIFSKPLSIRSIISKTLRYFRNRKRTECFETYLNNHLNLTKHIGSIRALKEEPFDFDAMICGSDQVWNLNIVGSVVGAYYLDFLDNNIRKIAFSASYEQIEPSFNYIEQIRQSLQSFDAISLREDNGIELTRELWGKEVIKTLDPCMLLTKNDYRKISNPIPIPNKYLLAYMLGNNKSMERLVCYASTRLNIPVINLGKKIYSLPKGSKYMPSIDPGGFIYLMENAQCVCTNSFHGSCFSILYEKPFVTFSRKGGNSRLSNLLKTFQMENRMVWESGEREEKILESLKVGCKVKDNIFDCEKNKSLEFLEMALK